MVVRHAPSYGEKLRTTDREIEVISPKEAKEIGLLQDMTVVSGNSVS